MSVRTHSADLQARVRFLGERIAAGHLGGRERSAVGVGDIVKTRGRAAREPW